MNSKETYFGIGDVKLFKTSNTWETKSGGKLTVPLALPIETLSKVFLHYNQKELQEIPEDIRGNKKEFTLKMGQGIWNRPYISHTYESLENHTILAVICNTLFSPKNPQTHDTYKEEKFRALQQSLL